MSKRNKSILPNRHNFEVLLERARQSGQINARHLYQIDVFHDDDCAIYRDAFCDCECEIRIEDITDLMSPYVN
jgi:hypothetical protein